MARRFRTALATDRTRAIKWSCDGLWCSSRGGVELLGLVLGMRSLFLARVNLSWRRCRGSLLGPLSSGDSGCCCSWLRSAIIVDWSLCSIFLRPGLSMGIYEQGSVWVWRGPVIWYEAGLSSGMRRVSVDLYEARLSLGMANASCR